MLLLKKKMIYFIPIVIFILFFNASKVNLSNTSTLSPETSFPNASLYSVVFSGRIDSISEKLIEVGEYGKAKNFSSIIKEASILYPEMKDFIINVKIVAPEKDFFLTQVLENTLLIDERLLDNFNLMHFELIRDAMPKLMFNSLTVAVNKELADYHDISMQKLDTLTQKIGDFAELELEDQMIILQELLNFNDSEYIKLLLCGVGQERLADVFRMLQKNAKTKNIFDDINDFKVYKTDEDILKAASHYLWEKNFTSAISRMDLSFSKLDAELNAEANKMYLSLGIDNIFSEAHSLSELQDSLNEFNYKFARLRFLNNNTMSAGEEDWLPEGYIPGKTKYIVITGSVISGLGKGITSASVAKLLQARGLNVAAMKLDGYLNVDAGTLSPYQHGEVFVTDDGTEADMDFGTYERFLDQGVAKENYLTNGKLFQKIIEKERKGDYLGKDVQMANQVSGEIRKFVRENAVKTKADVILVEIGGTVGDMENINFMRSMKRLADEEGAENVCFMALTRVIQQFEEQKSKAAQNGIIQHHELGIQPDFIFSRQEKPLDQKVRAKIASAAHVPTNQVVDMHDVADVSLIPLALHEQGVDRMVMERLGIPIKKAADLKAWQEFSDGVLYPKNEIVIGVAGKYTEVTDAYASIKESLVHSGSFFKTKVRIKWVDTRALDKAGADVEAELGDIDALIVPGGFGTDGIEGKIKAVEYARENKMPFLGICYGFQLAVIEFARNVCGLKEAQTTEVDPNTPFPVITDLPGLNQELLGGTMRLGGHNVLLTPNTLASKLYGNEAKARERFRHRYECNPSYIKLLEERGMVFSGKSEEAQDKIMQIMELPSHPYFIGGQFHPELTSRPGRPNPLFKGLVEAALKSKATKVDIISKEQPIVLSAA